MTSGLVGFEEIIESVKEETGIENMRPLYERIGRLVFRAERQIGYSGAVTLMKKTYKLGTDFNGSFLKYPLDLIEVEGIGQDGYPLNDRHYTANPESIRFKGKRTKNVVLLYWGLNVDENSYPIVTRNHEEAVVAFVVWKLYSSKMFLGIGNMNANKYYKDTFENELLAARGDDAFPTLEQWNDLGALTYTDRRILINEPVHSYDYSEDETCSEESTNATVFYWQLDTMDETLEDIKPFLQNTTYLFSKPQETYDVFEQGHKVTYNNVARIAFAIYQTTDQNFVLNDSLNNDITDEFETYYSEALQAIVFVSLNVISYSTLYFNFKKL